MTPEESAIESQRMLAENAINLTEAQQLAFSESAKLMRENFDNVVLVYYTKGLDGETVRLVTWHGHPKELAFGLTYGLKNLIQHIQ